MKYFKIYVNDIGVGIYIFLIKKKLNEILFILLNNMCLKFI